jgi:hypothetical protein
MGLLYTGKRLHLDDQDKDGRITLRWVLAKHVVRMEGEWCYYKRMTNAIYVG